MERSEFILQMLIELTKQIQSDIKTITDNTMESKYTKAERHEIYKKALKLLIKEPSFICYAIAKITRKHPKEIDFPELFQFIPDKTYWLGGWFNEFNTPLNEVDIDNTETRIKRQQILMFCIEMTKP